MKKVFGLATAALMFTGVAFAVNHDKGKKKKCGESKCCKKGTATASKTKTGKTVKM